MYIHNTAMRQVRLLVGIKVSIQILGRTLKFWTIASGELSKFGQ